jgi:hypothetical protein
MPTRDAAEAAGAIHAAAALYEETVAIYEAAKADFELLKDKVAQDRESRRARRSATLAKEDHRGRGLSIVATRPSSNKRQR